MKKEPVTPTAEELLNAKNEVVKKAFFNTVSEIKQLIHHYPSDYLRTYLEIDYTSIPFSIRHGLFSPLLHLRLDEHASELSIYYAKNYTFKNQVGNYLDSLLTRCVYKNTATEATEIDIQDALSVCIYNVDDFRQAKNLLDRGFKDGQKVTVEPLKKEA